MTDLVCLFLAGLYRVEQAIAERPRMLSSGHLPWSEIDADKAIPWVEAPTGLTLAASQRTAVGLALRSKVLVITGGPGIGKTTLVNSILKIIRAKGIEVALCAPIGRTAKRLTESTGLEGRTIHRLLESDPKTGGFKRGEEHSLDCGLLVVDEASMVDVLLTRALLRALPDQAALLVVGDIDQLPSVGPGQVLTERRSAKSRPVCTICPRCRSCARFASAGRRRTPWRWRKSSTTARARRSLPTRGPRPATCRKA